MDILDKLRGGVIMDVTTPEQAKIAEDAGAVAVMALERIPADIRAAGGVSRMSDPKMIKEIMKTVKIPVMAKVRIGHFVEARILEAINIDFIDESEVLSPADEVHHVDKTQFKTPFVCGARNLGEALRRIQEGAKMIRTKGEAGTGDVIQAVKHMRAIMKEMKELTVLREDELYVAAKNFAVPYALVEYVHKMVSSLYLTFRRGVWQLLRMRLLWCTWERMVCLWVVVYSNLEIPKRELKRLCKLSSITMIMQN